VPSEQLVTAPGVLVSAPNLIEVGFAALPVNKDASADQSARRHSDCAVFFVDAADVIAATATSIIGLS